MNLRKTVDELDLKYQVRKVVIVDEADTEIRTTGLIEAHRDPGIRHRAFSLQLYRVKGAKKELLLQQRAESKPVFPLYWANTCCYNLAPGEDYIPRAVSRVREEMGVVVAEESLKLLYKFAYYAPDIEGWCENELDTVIVGEWDGEVRPNHDEARDYKWMTLEEIDREIEQKPEDYAPWFQMIVADPRFRSIFE